MATDASAALLSGYRVAAEQTGFAPHDTKSQGACQIQSEGSAIAQGKGVGRGLKWSGLDFTPVEPVRCRSEAREAVKADKRMSWRIFLERLQYDGLKGVG